MSVLSNNDIINIAKKMNINLICCISKDKLININHQNGFYIINMEDSDKGNGSHWVIFHINNNDYYYMDSFGLRAPIIVENYLNHNYYYNDKEIQHINSNCCGWYCILLCLFIMNNKGNIKERYKKFYKLFNYKDYYKNDEILYKYINKYIKNKIE